METIAQGKIDWEDLVGQLIYSVNQMGKAQFLRDLSRNVCRAQLQDAMKGRGTGGNRIPYGYRSKRIVDEYGKVVDYRLVVESHEAEIVRRIYRMYLELEGSVRGVAVQLNAEGVPGPTGKKWSPNTIDQVLRRRKYTGAFVWGVRGAGRYHTTCTGEITLRRKNTPSTKGQPIVHEDNHDAIIQRDVFDRVQSKLKNNSQKTRPKRYRKYILSGLLRCGECGGSMVGVRSKTKTGSQRYMCKTYSDKGRSVCNCNSIAEDILLDCLIRKIEELYLSDDAIERLRIAISDQLHEERPPVVDLAALRKKLSDVEKQIAVGSERVFTAPDSVIESLYARLDDLQKTKKRLEAQIEAAKAPASNDCADLDATVKEAIALLEDLRTTIRKAEPEHLTELMRSLVSRVEL